MYPGPKIKHQDNEMTLTELQWEQFDAIRFEMSDWIQRSPDMYHLTIKDANQVYHSRIKRKLESVLAWYCRSKEDRRILRSYCFKYYNL